MFAKAIRASAFEFPRAVVKYKLEPSATSSVVKAEIVLLIVVTCPST